MLTHQCFLATIKRKYLVEALLVEDHRELREARGKPTEQFVAVSLNDDMSKIV